MDERDELQQKIADIGGRYIQRTAGEVASLRDLIAKVRAGNAAAFKDIEHLKNEPKLDSLRSNDEFKKWLAAMEAELK